jgi:hypothetical protein
MAKWRWSHLMVWRCMPIFLAFVLALGAIILPPAAAEAALRFLVLGDTRGTSTAAPINTAAIADLNARILTLEPKPEFILCLGDMGLYGGSAIFQAWKDALKPVTDAGIRLYVALGNHELCQQGMGGTFYRTNQQAFQQVFAEMPGNGPAGYERLVYSFESQDGDSFFAVLDPFYLDAATSQKPGDEGAVDGDQLSWLGNQISQTKAKHKFVCLHVPAFTVSSTHIAPASYLNLWSLLDNNKFAIYFAGHVHLYSRKNIDRTLDPRWHNHVVQLINGTSGVPADSGQIIVDPGSWHINRGLYYYVVADINNNQIVVQSYGGNNGVYNLIDTFILTATASLPTLDLLLLN